MWPLLLPIIKYAVPSLIGAAAGAAGAKWQNDTNRGNVQRQVQANADNMAWQEKMMDKMADYNSPVQQMLRLKQAGLNPMMAATGIAGSGAMSGFSGAPNQAAVNSVGDIGQALTSLSQLANISNVLQQTKLMQQKQLTSAAQSGLLTTQRDYYTIKRKMLDLNYDIGRYNYDVSRARGLRTTDTSDLRGIFGSVVGDIVGAFRRHHENTRSRSFNWSNEIFDAFNRRF